MIARQLSKAVFNICMFSIGVCALVPISYAQMQCLDDDLIVNRGAINLTVGMHNKVGDLIGDKFEASGTLVDCTGTRLINNNMMRASKPAVGGLTVNYGGRVYPVFDTGIPNIGYAIGVSTSHDSSVKPLPESDWLRTYDGVGVSTLEHNFWIQFVATGRLQAGTYNLSSTSPLVMNLTGAGPNNVGYFWYLKVNATFNITASTCQVKSGHIYRSMTLPTVSTHSFNKLAIGETTGKSNPITIQLDCEPSVQVFAGVSDGLAPSNMLTTVLTLSDDGTPAKGVGVQMFRDDNPSPLWLGLDSTDSGAHQWLLGNSGAAGGTVSTTLYSKYIKTAAKVEGGDVNAIALVTFSYR